MVMKPTVYIETTIPSYYCDDRPELMGDIARTQEWWDKERGDYECFISPVVIEELSAGNYATRSKCLRLIDSIPLLEVNREVAQIAAIYQEQKLMPSPPVRDALHLSLAAYYRLDYLLTWNCRHLANANKIPRLQKLNRELNLSMPLLVTPAMLQRWEVGDE